MSKLDEAIAAARRGDDAEALRLVDAHLAEHPDDARAIDLLDELTPRRALAQDFPDAPEPPVRFGDLRADDGWRPSREPARVETPPRPFGATVLATIDFLVGGVALLLGLMLLSVSPVAVLVLGAGAAAIALGRGLLRLRSWAWFLSILLAGIGLLASFFGGGPVEVALSLAASVLEIALLLTISPAFGTRDAPGRPLTEAQRTRSSLVAAAFIALFVLRMIAGIPRLGR